MKVLRINSELCDSLQKKGIYDGLFLANNPKNIFEEVHLLQPFSPSDEKERVEKTGCFYIYFTPRLRNPVRKIPVFGIFVEGLCLCLTWFKLARKGVRIVQKHSIDGIRTTEALLWFGTLALFISWKTKVPFAISIHANLENEKYLHSYKAKLIHRIKNNGFLAGIILRRAKIFLAFSKLLENYALKHGVKKENIRRIYILPAHLEKYNKERKPDENFFTLLFVGSLRPQKNIVCILKAFQTAKKNIHNLRLWLIGDGPLKEDLERFVEKHQLKDVQFLGAIQNDKIPDRMYLCDAFIHASQNEGFSNTILEAQVMGLPIISSNIPEKEESVNEGNALLFKDNDHGDCAKCIEMLYNDKEKQKGLSGASLKSAQKYFDAKPEECNAKNFIELCS